MINVSNFLLAISLIMAFGLTSNGVNSDNVLCPVQFPEGFYCDLICQKWGILSGNTIMCFISNQGNYQRIIARNPAFGVWRFYKIDETAHGESFCESSVIGDEFYLNDTEIMCINHKFKGKRYYLHNPRTSGSKSQEHPSEYGRDVGARVSMNAICELATAHLCRQKKMIYCGNDNKCCYSKLKPDTCKEETMSKFNDCYKVLYNVMTSALYY